MTTKRFTLTGLRAYLASKPAKTWTTGIRHDSKGRCCVLGHLENLIDVPQFALDTYDSSPVLAPFEKLTARYPRAGFGLAEINNGDDPCYQQKTPRARVLAAIDDLIARRVPKAP